MSLPIFIAFVTRSIVPVLCAFEMAKAQGMKPIQSLEELRPNVKPELVDDLIDTVLENRKKNRRQLKSHF